MNGILAELQGAASECLVIMTTFLQCHDFCHSLMGQLQPSCLIRLAARNINFVLHTYFCYHRDRSFAPGPDIRTVPMSYSTNKFTQSQLPFSAL